jgi:hypothetical protein
MSIVEPTAPLDPDETYTFIFRITRDMSSDERVVYMHVLFYPVDVTLIEGSMGYAEIAPGRPCFQETLYSTVARWTDTTATGGVWMGESTDVWFDVKMPADLPPASVGHVGWSVRGSLGNQNGGTFHIYTPVAETSWGRIKALYGEGHGRQLPN